MAKPLKLEHVHIHAVDLAGMGRFLEIGLGATLTIKRSTNNFDNWEYELDGLGISLARAEGHRSPGPLDHLGFRVDDIQMAIDHLERNGCTLSEGPVVWRPDLTFAYLTGPEGLRIELLQRS